MSETPETPEAADQAPANPFARRNPAPPASTPVPPVSSVTQPLAAEPPAEAANPFAARRGAPVREDAEPPVSLPPAVGPTVRLGEPAASDSGGNPFAERRASSGVRTEPLAQQTAIVPPVQPPVEPMRQMPVQTPAALPAELRAVRTWSWVAMVLSALSALVLLFGSAAVFPIPLAIFAAFIAYASYDNARRLNGPAGKPTVNLTTLGVLQIAGLLFGNFLLFCVGVYMLILSGKPEVKNYYDRYMR